MITVQISSTTPVTAIENILLSNFRCMKILNTNEDLIEAITSASTTVRVPRYICVRATEVSVRAISPASTRMNVL